MEFKKLYLGDGVYLEESYYDIALKTSTEFKTQIIYLDDRVQETLFYYLENKFRKDKTNEKN